MTVAKKYGDLWNPLIEDFEDGKSEHGIEKFQADMVKSLEEHIQNIETHSKNMETMCTTLNYHYGSGAIHT